MTCQPPYLIKIQNQAKCKGFSILETLVAITVLTVGLVGVVGLINYNISIARTSPDKVIAVNLAQEGIEVVRNIRDSNWLGDIADDGIRNNSFAWDNNIIYGNSIPIFTDNDRNDWPSDPDIWTLKNIGGAESWKEKVYYDEVDEFYGQSKKQSTNPAQFPEDWVPTIFTRKITITDDPDGDPATEDIKVESIVNWTDRSGTPHTITLEDHLYDYTLPGNNPPTRYYWDRVYGGCQRTGGNPVICGQAGLGIDWSVKAPCDTTSCWDCGLSGKTAFGGDPDWLWDYCSGTCYFFTCSSSTPRPACAFDARGCCNVYKKTVE